MDPTPRAGRTAALAAIAVAAPKDSRRFLSVDIKGEIDAKMSARIAEQLRDNPAATTVWVVVDSLGGDVRSAVELYRTIREHPASKKVANAYGDIASAAVLPYLAGDVRNASQRARFLLHAAAIPLQGKGRWTAERYQLHADAIRAADAAAREIILERTGMSAAVLAGEFDDEAGMPIQKAVSAGLVHSVDGITPPLDKHWPERARAMMRARKTISMGAESYRFGDSYLAACRLS